MRVNIILIEATTKRRGVINDDAPIKNRSGIKASKARTETDKRVWLLQGRFANIRHIIMIMDRMQKIAVSN